MWVRERVAFSTAWPGVSDKIWATVVFHKDFHFSNSNQSVSRKWFLWKHELKQVAAVSRPCGIFKGGSSLLQREILGVCTRSWWLRLLCASAWMRTQRFLRRALNLSPNFNSLSGLTFLLNICFRDWGGIRWQSVCLVCMKSWVQLHNWGSKQANKNSKANNNKKKNQNQNKTKQTQKAHASPKLASKDLGTRTMSEKWKMCVCYLPSAAS